MTAHIGARHDLSSKIHPLSPLSQNSIPATISCTHVLAQGDVESPMKKKLVVVSAFTPEANLKRKLRAHLRKLGFERTRRGALKPPSSSKETIRALHQEQRKAILKKQRPFVSKALPALGGDDLKHLVSIHYVRWRTNHLNDPPMVFELRLFA